jgi:hypothetical protein
MTLFGISAATLLAWLLTLAFLGAGVVNAAGSAAIKDDFVRWGYPRWWNLVTGGLEVLTAALIAMPAARVAGLMLSAAICVAAVATVVRYKDYGRVAPGAVLTKHHFKEIHHVGESLLARVSEALTGFLPGCPACGMLIDGADFVPADQPQDRQPAAPAAHR